MEIATFPICCGAINIYDFGYRSGMSPFKAEEEFTKLQICNYLKKTVKNYKGFAFLSLILNRIQYSHLKNTVEKAGFELVKKANGAHGWPLYFYMYVNPAELGPETR